MADFITNILDLALFGQHISQSIFKKSRVLVYFPMLFYYFYSSRRRCLGETRMFFVSCLVLSRLVWRRLALHSILLCVCVCVSFVLASTLQVCVECCVNYCECI